MKRVKRASKKRLPSSSEETEESENESLPKPKPKPKLPPKKKKIQDSDSSSESDIENYLQPIGKIDLNLPFFNIVTRNDAKKEKLEGTLSSSDEEVNETVIENKTYEGYNPDAFKQLEEYTKKMEDVKKHVEMYTAKKKAAENSEDISNLLAEGEAKIDTSSPEKQSALTNTSEYESFESENSDWEEVKMKEIQQKAKMIPKENLQIEIDLPQVNKKKKGDDLLAAFKRRLNRKKKEAQALVHKVHVLCWLGHGNYVNAALCNEKILGLSLSLLPSQQSYPGGRIDLKYLEQILKWYRKTMNNVEKVAPKNISLPNLLQLQVHKRECYNKKMLVYLFITVLRALGISARLVLSFQVEPLRPPQSELHSLTSKKEDKIDQTEKAKFIADEKEKNSKKYVVKGMFSAKNLGEDLGSSSKAEKANKKDKTPQEDSPKKSKDADSKKKPVSEPEKISEKPSRKRKLAQDPKEKVDKTTSKPVTAKEDKSELEQVTYDKKFSKKQSVKVENLKLPPTEKRTSKSPLKIEQIDYKKESQKDPPVKNLKVNLENLKIPAEKPQNKRSKSAGSKTATKEVTVFLENLKIPKTTRSKGAEKETTKKTTRAKKDTTKDTIKVKIPNKEETKRRVGLRKKTVEQLDGIFDPTDSSGSDDEYIPSSEEENDEFRFSFCRNIPQLDGSSDEKTKRRAPKRNEKAKEPSKSKENAKESAKPKEAQVKNRKKPNLSKLSPKSAEPSPSKPKRARMSVAKYAESSDSGSDSFEKSPTLIKTKKPNLTKLSQSKQDRKPAGSTSNLNSSMDIRNDIMSLMKARINESKAVEKRRKLKSRGRKTAPVESNDDSDYVPEEEPKKKHDSGDEFVPKTKVKQRVQVKKKQPTDRRVMSSESEPENSKTKPTKKKKGVDVWCEVFLEDEEKWISVDVVQGEIHCVEKIYQRATHPISYIVAWDNNNHLKDVTRRYCQNFSTVTRKLRTGPEWYEKATTPFRGPNNARDKEEDDELARQQLEKPLPKVISEYKNHPLYALERHLLKFEAIYPPNAITLGFVRNEPVYPRECVYTCRSRDIWLKEAKTVKPGEKAYKIVKARPKYDRLSNAMVAAPDLEIFGIWQTQDYDPPTAENGIVPRNAFGNVELFKECMLPKKCVHLKLPGLNKVAKKMNIDCASAIVGFDFHSGWSHPVYDGFVVCEEFADHLILAWEEEQEEMEKREQEKYEKRVFGNWKRLIKGLLIRERLKAKYDFGNVPSSSGVEKEPKKAKGPKFCTSKSKKRRSKSPQG